jgi:DNA-binding response OmpR family regulator
MKKVLIIENDEKFAFALSVRLQANGYPTWIARDPALGLSLAVSNRPDLVVVDTTLPGADGFSLAERIQKNIPDPTPIIFLRSAGAPEDKERAQRVGAAALFEKSYETEPLLSAVKQALA